MSNILITGNCGFIGSHLYQRLTEKGHSVVGIDNLSHACGNKVPTEYCDVRDFHGLLPYFSNCDVVFHLAAEISVDKSIDSPEITIATNVLGTQNILELARRFGIKVVFASSSEIYGSSKTEYMNESHPLDAQSPYAASKVAGDRLCYAYQRTFGLNVNIVRNFNTFGPYQADDSYGGVIAKFTKAALAGEPLEIYGNGRQERDYMWIDDAVQAYEMALDQLFYQPVNFGSGKTISIINLATMIVDLCKSKSDIKFIFPRKGEVQRLCADISRAKIIGFNPTTDFQKHLGEYILWKQNQ